MNYIFVSGTYLIQYDQNWNKTVLCDVFIICDTSTAPVNIILPEISSSFLLTKFHISDASTNASTNNITITPSGTDSINGTSSLTILTDNGSVICFVSSSNATTSNLITIDSKWIALESTVSGAGLTTANNGLTLTGANVQLGGVLIKNSTVSTNSIYKLSFVGTNTNNKSYVVDITNLSGGNALGCFSSAKSGIYSESVNGTGVEGYSENSYAGYFVSNTNVGLVAQSNSIQAFESVGYLPSNFFVAYATSNTIDALLNVKKSVTGGVYSAGNGGSIDFYLDNSSISSQIISVLEDTTLGSKDSSIGFTNLTNNVLSRKMNIQETGQITFDEYGTNNFSDNSPAYYLGTDSTGNVVEVDLLQSRNYGSFYDTTTQLASVINTPYAMKLNSTDGSCTNGISVVNDAFGFPTKITVTKTSIYNLQFSAQLNRTSGGASRTISIWVRKNGSDISNTNTQLSIQANANKVVAAWNFLVPLSAGDNVQLMWSVPDTTIEILYEAINLTIPHPATPSLIVTIMEV